MITQRTFWDLRFYYWTKMSTSLLALCDLHNNNFLQYSFLCICYVRVAAQLECGRSKVQVTPQAEVWMLVSIKYRSVVDTGEIKAARYGTGHPTSQMRLSRISVLSNKLFAKYESRGGLLYVYSMFFLLHFSVWLVRPWFWQQTIYLFPLFV